MRTHDPDIAGTPTVFRPFNASILDAAEPRTVEAPAITETEGERYELCGTTDARLDYTTDGRVLACPPCRQRYEENA